MFALACVIFAIDQIEKIGLNSLQVIYYFENLFI
ncbi:hypothetical protein XENE109146_12120 [Xenorhabdus nematophila]